MYKIYKLIFNNEIIYIGITKLKLSRRKNSPNYSVPKEIYKKSEILLIEETDDKSRERYWINFYRNEGIKLYNKRGGDFSNQYTAYMKKREMPHYKNDKRIQKIKEYQKEYRNKNKKLN